MKVTLQEASTQSKLVKLGEVLDSIEAGKSFKAEQRPASSGEWGVLKISALTWGEFQPQENKALLSDSDPSGIPTVHAGDLMISRANTVELVGAVAMADKDYPHLVLSDKTLRLNPNPQYVDSRYLLYALRRPEARKHIESHATGTSGSMRNITQANIRRIPITLPPLEEQRRIAAILDKADGVRRKRREAIRLTEELLRSQFLEMFGDPVSNPKGWTISIENLILKFGATIKPLSEIADVIDCKHRTPVYVETGYPVVRPRDVREKGIQLHKCLKTSQEEYVDLTDKREPQKGDIVYSRNATFGVASLVDIDDKFAIGQDVCLIVPHSINSAFLHYLLNSHFVRRQLGLAISGTTFKRINLKEIRKLKILVPDRKLQEKFSNFYFICKDNLACLSKTLQEADNLFNSLLQRAFRGDL